MTEIEISKLQEWENILRDLTIFVKIADVKGIRFIVHTNENTKHHRAHLHVEMSNASLSIAIDNGDILDQSGKILPAQKKLAKEWMQDNKELIVRRWNEFSNGIALPTM